MSELREVALQEWRRGCRARRMEAQDEGRALARRMEPLHMAYAGLGGYRWLD